MANSHPPRLKTSKFSTRSSRQRKFSKHRYQRQARQSIFNEESRTARPLPVGVGVGADSDVRFADPDFGNITTLSRASTGLSPLEVHPGQLVDIRTLMPFPSRQGSSSGPFPEPNDDGSNAFSHSATITPLDIEGAPGPLCERGPQAGIGVASLRSLYNQIWRRNISREDARPKVRDDTRTGAKQAGRVGFHPHALPKDRRVLYVLEYDQGEAEYPTREQG